MRGSASIQIKLSDHSSVSNALKVLGYSAACKDGYATISIQNPAVRKIHTRLKRTKVVEDEMFTHQTRKAYGAPRLLTLDRIRHVKSPDAPSRNVVSPEDLLSIVARLSAPRKPRQQSKIIEDDSPRIGFRITLSKRSLHQQQLYMERLSVPRSVFCTEPVEYHVAIPRHLTEEELTAHVQRLSKPRSLESLLVRYALPGEDYINTVEDSINTVEDSITKDACIMRIVPPAIVELSPYQMVSANQIAPRSIDNKDPLVTVVTFLCKNILNIVTKGEEEFPDQVDTFAARLLEVSILPALETRPLRREIHDLPKVVSTKDSLETAKFLELVHLFPPNRVLVCRLESLIETLIKHILTLHSGAQ